MGGKGCSPATPAAEGVNGFEHKAVGGSKGVCPFGHRRLNSLREGEAASLSERWKGESEAVPPPRAHRGDGWSEDGWGTPRDRTHPKIEYNSYQEVVAYSTQLLFPNQFEKDASR
jgi:hypothetical protein